MTSNEFEREKKKLPLNVIEVDFRKEKLSIDDDLYLKDVTEIHCRICSHRKPRKGAREFSTTWGYMCKCCYEKKAASGEEPQIVFGDKTFQLETYRRAGRFSR